MKKLFTKILLVGFAVALPFLVCWFAEHSSKIRVTPDGIRIPAWEILPEEAVDSSYPSYFYYNQPCLRYEGRFYWPYNRSFRYSDLKLADPVIPITCQEDSYSAYAIQGIDPAVMLCIKNESDSLFIHNNDLTLRTGADLFEKRIPLLGRYTDAYFSYKPPLETEDSYRYYDIWNYQTFFIRKEYHPLLDRFLEALNKAPALRIEDTPLWQRFQSGSRTSCPLYLKLDNGVIVILYLYEGGYVCAENFWGVCFSLEPEDFSALLSLLTDRSAYLPVESIYEEVPACLDYATCRLHKSFGHFLPSSPPASLDTPEAI